VDFYLTQILSGHGCFRSYLKKYEHDTRDGCPSCGECVRLVEDRTALETVTGVSISPSTLVRTIQRGQMKLDATAKFAAKTQDS